MSAALPPLIQQYKADSESVYNTWFINNEERLKAFRSIRRGVQQVVKDIKAGSFGLPILQRTCRHSTLERRRVEVTLQERLKEDVSDRPEYSDLKRLLGRAIRPFFLPQGE